MKYLVNASEMRRYDSNTIEKIGIPACVLMERAALAVAEAVERHCAGFMGERCVLVLAGMGNNGGDGLAAARLLAEKGYQVEVWCVGNREKASAQWLQQMDILEKYPVERIDRPKKQTYTVLLDALFGVGLSREVSGSFACAVDTFNALGGWKLALDLPSGIDSDTGKVWGTAVRASATVTFGFCKRGLMLYPGHGYAGNVTIADIGISSRSFYGEEPGMYAYEGDAAALLPERDRGGNKGTFGKVLLTAGSRNMAGAAVLSARAAYRAGAGMVKVLTPRENRIILQQAVPEALLGTLEEISQGMEWADVLAIGPGLGKGETAGKCLGQAVLESGRPLLIDADGLNLLSEDRNLRAALSNQGKEGRKIVLTPHVGEMARLTGRSVSECGGNLPAFGMELAKELHGVVAAKDARTFICGEDHAICVNLSGNSGMATAGSGDVLAGVIAGLLAQGMEVFEAAAVGAYIHGCAGDEASRRRGEHACMAEDIIEALGSGFFCMESGTF